MFRRIWKSTHSYWCTEWSDWVGEEVVQRGEAFKSFWAIADTSISVNEGSVSEVDVSPFLILTDFWLIWSCIQTDARFQILWFVPWQISRHRKFSDFLDFFMNWKSFFLIIFLQTLFAEKTPRTTSLVSTLQPFSNTFSSKMFVRNAEIFRFVER